MRPTAGKAALRPAQKRRRSASDCETRISPRAGGSQHLGDAGNFLGDFFRRAVGFAEQDGRRVEVVAGLDVGLDGGGRRLVHHLQPGRDDAGGDDRRHRVAGPGDIVERSHDHLRQFRLRHQLDGHFGDDAEHAFRADQQRQQVVTRRIRRFRADLEHLALDADARGCAARYAPSGRISGNARRPSSRRRCRPACRRSATRDRARNKGRRAPPPPTPPGCARRAGRWRCGCRGRPSKSC